MIRIALWSLLALAFPASAQIALLPSAPRVHDMIEIQVDGALIAQEWASSAGPEVTMAGNKITVTVPLTGGNGIPVNLDWALGAFPAGSYQVEVVRRTPAGAFSSVAQANFTVSLRTGNVPHTSYSDLWFNPSESGWGINIQQHPSDKIFATWFVYGLDNKPTWFVIPDGTWTSDREYTGTIYRTHGPFFQDAWNASLVSVIPAGTARLQFTKYNSLVLLYTIDGIPGQKTAVRQGF